MLTYLQPENIVLREKEGRNINIIGFGSALKLVPGKKAMSNITNLNALWEFWYTRILGHSTPLILVAPMWPNS